MLKQIISTRFFILLFLLKINTISVLGSVNSVAVPSPDKKGFNGIVKKVLPTVVSLSVMKEYQNQYNVDVPQAPQGQGSPFEELLRRFFEDFRKEPQRVTSLGSGFFVDENFIVTNAHVIKDAKKITVILEDDKKTELIATVVGKDFRTDIALLKVSSSKKFEYIKWGDSDKVNVGDWAIAIGNPFGFGKTVSVGVISYSKRSINLDSQSIVSNFLQFDGAVNMGNSGGPLFNTDGEVVGITNAIASPTGGNIGIGFAIPSKVAIKVINDLKKYGRTKRGWIGVSVQPVTKEIAESLGGIPEIGGALVEEVVKDGPSSKAGMQIGDVILKFNGRVINNDLPQVVSETKIGSKVPVIVLRDGKKKTLRVLVAEFEEAQKQELIPGYESKEIKILGLTLKVITPSLTERFKLELSKGTKGILITDVNPRSDAYLSGFRRGDVIIEAGRYRKKISSPSEFINIIKQAKNKKQKRIIVRINRRGASFYTTLSINEESS